MEYAEIGCWMYASQRQVARLRLKFLNTVLRQDIGAFDTELTTGKVLTGISNHMSLIQDTIGEKVHKLIPVNIIVSFKAFTKNLS